MDSAGSSNKSGTKIEHLDFLQQVADDHHYLSSNKSGKARKYINDNNAPLHSTILKEWKILKKNLPDSIYVQAYETRFDLLRAVIVGSPGTPYHDGLFFFDILLPSDYPGTPPKVKYHAHGHRLNPNLYANGKVCLSLINTWSGSKDEKWTANSTILQILVSIQGLVLNERPYFNEPGFEAGKNSTCSRLVNRSIEYNETAFVLSCLTMLKIMKKPPKGFEGFVARHFRERTGSIVAAIEAYRAGRVLVGEYGVNNVRASSSFKVSRLFKNNLAAILPKIRTGAEKICEAKTESRVDVKKASTSSSSGSKSGKKGKTDQENVKKQSKGVLKRITTFVKSLFK